MTTISIPSPCISVCTLEPDTGLCQGCLRTESEIERWPLAGDQERLEIVRSLRARRRARGRTSAADSRPRRRSGRRLGTVSGDGLS